MRYAMRPEAMSASIWGRPAGVARTEMIAMGPLTDRIVLTAPTAPICVR
jgi:hypothetical protein